MTITCKPHGTCSNKMIIEVEGDIIRSLRVEGGCAGNSKGIAQLVAGMRIGDVITRLEGIRCGQKATSCPDQLAQALKAHTASEVSQ